MKMLMPLTSIWEGVAEGEGVIVMAPKGTLPQALEKESRDFIRVINTPLKTIQAILPADCVVWYEACEGDPFNEDHWVTVEIINATTQFEDNVLRSFVRFGVTEHDEDEIRITLTASS